jgi:TonB family protein
MARIKINMMTDKPDITEEEIRNSMNFDQVLNLANTNLLHQRKRVRRVKAGLYIAGVVVLGLTAYWLLTPLPPVMPKNSTASHSTPVHAAPDSISETPSIIANVPQDKTPKPTGTPGKSAATILQPSPIVSDSVAEVYVPAEPVKGFPALYEYFNRELNYPQEAIKDSTQGVITVNFVIDQHGAPINLKIANSLGPAFDAEAIRLIQNMPRWKAARLSGREIDSKISIPLTFHIKTVKQSR